MAILTVAVSAIMFTSCEKDEALTNHQIIPTKSTSITYTIKCGIKDMVLVGADLKDKDGNVGGLYVNDKDTTEGVFHVKATAPGSPTYDHTYSEKTVRDVLIITCDGEPDDCRVGPWTNGSRYVNNAIYHRL